MWLNHIPLASFCHTSLQSRLNAVDGFRLWAPLWLINVGHFYQRALSVCAFDVINLSLFLSLSAYTCVWPSDRYSFTLDISMIDIHLSDLLLFGIARENCNRTHSMRLQDLHFFLLNILSLCMLFFFLHSMPYSQTTWITVEICPKIVLSSNNKSIFPVFAQFNVAYIRSL